MKDPRKLSFPRLEVIPREASRHFLRNGIVVHALEDRSLPTVSLGLLARAGAVNDPADRVGLGSMTAEAVRVGGSRLLPGDALDEELDFLGTRLDCWMDDDGLASHCWTLERQLTRTLEILASLLREPAFPADKVELVRLRELEMVQRRWDTPQQVAGLMYRRAVYGPGNPWGRLDSAATVKAVTRDDMVGLARAILRPQGIVMAFSGAFKTEELLATLDRFLGDWNPGPVEPAPVPEVSGSLPAGIYLVPRSIGQANLRMGHLSIRNGDPDQFPLRLMDLVLGNGSFNSRLFRDIRTKRGLAYSIWSRLQARAVVDGTFTIGGETKYDTLHEAVGALLAHVKDLREHEATAEEVKLAKDQLDHGLAFEFQSAWSVAWRAAYYEYYGLPADWLMRERAGVLGATRGDVLRVARAHLHPERMIILAVGDPEKCRPALAQFGEVHDLPIPDQPAA